LWSKQLTKTQKTEIGVNAWVLHQNKDVYGPDPETFRPERWIGEEKTSLMESMMFAVRQQSRRNYVTGI
jgi:cytochrome P450